MARKKTRTRAKKKAPTRTARAKARPKPAAKPKPAARARRAKGAPGSDVERRWNEYWACRKKLEEAVEEVRGAREALQVAQDAERACRSEFETIKGSLTDLLDVEPASGARSQPTAVPRQGGAPQGLPAPQSVGGPKPAS